MLAVLLHISSTDHHRQYHRSPAISSHPIPTDSMIQLLFTVLSCLCGFILFIYYYYHHHHHQLRNPISAATSNRPLPRAAGALPIIGHLHLFAGKELTHKTLAAMAEKHGPAFTIKLGSQQNLVVSSWEMAKECFTTLDKVFADRPTLAATRILTYNCAMFGFSPYGPYWRQMRKIATLELFSHRRIDSLSHIRAAELRTSLKEIFDSCADEPGRKTGQVVDMKQWFGDLTLNAFVRMVGGKRFVTENEKKLMRNFFYYFGVFVLSDAIPWLGWLDLQGHERSMRRIAKELDQVIGEWLDEHKQRRKANGGDGVDEDFMDVMLTTMEGAEFPAFEADTITKSTCLNMVLAGSDTIMVTLTWAMSLLLNHPDALSKARDEVDAYVGNDRHVNESDINKLVYLEAVVKETLRLYPAAPVIGLHSALEDCTLSPGFHVPAGTRLMVNIWKIQRDGKLWPEPLEFRPERFLRSHKEFDMKGHDFEFMPFGSGRRSCPAASLSLRMVHLTLASLLHCYDLARPSEAEIDMTESAGLTNLKATPLRVRLTPRLLPHIYEI